MDLESDEFKSLLPQEPTDSLDYARHVAMALFKHLNYHVYDGETVDYFIAVQDHLLLVVHVRDIHTDENIATILNNYDSIFRSVSAKPFKSFLENPPWFVLVDTCAEYVVVDLITAADKDDMFVNRGVCFGTVHKE